MSSPPAMAALWRLRQEDAECEASLGYRVPAGWCGLQRERAYMEKNKKINKLRQYALTHCKKKMLEPKCNQYKNYQQIILFIYSILFCL